MIGVVQCFWLERTELVDVQLRRFTFERDKKCRNGNGGGHEGSHVILERVQRSSWVEDLGDCVESTRDNLVSREDPRWPECCEKCGEPFQIDDEWQVNTFALYRSPDANLYTIRRAPPGAMWDATWWPANSADGISLTVKLPDGTNWLVDDGRWTRAGDPRAGTVSVQPSIRSPRYHGHLTNGKLEPQPDTQT